MTVHERVAILGGADPANPLESDNRVRHTAVGVLLLAVAVWAFTASTAAFHSNLKAPWPLAVLGGTLIAVIIFSIDLLVTATQLKDDGVSARLKVIFVRGMVSLAMGLVISHATILFMYRDTLARKVSDKNNALAAATTERIMKTSKWTPLIDEATRQVAKDQAQVTAENQTLADAQKRLADLQKAWSDDEVCVNGNRAANGDLCGPGPSADPLKVAFENYRDVTLPAVVKNHDAQVTALTSDIINQNKIIVADTAERADEIKKAVESILADTGLSAQTDALVDLLRHDLFAWLWPLFFIVVDLAVALMKGLLPESDFDRARRMRRAVTDRINGALADSAHLKDVLEHAATRQAEVARERINREVDQQLAVLRGDVLVRRRWVPARRRAAFAGVAGLVVIVLVLAGATPIGRGAGRVIEAGMKATGGQSIALHNGLTLQVPQGAISGNAPVAAAYRSSRPWSGHVPASDTVEFTTTGKVIGKPRLSIPVPAGQEQAAQVGAVQLAFESKDPSGWTPYPATYDPATHSMVAELTHFSTWQFWTWDWVNIGADISQTLGQWAGRRSSHAAACDAKLRTPAWYNTNAGITNEPAMVVRSCVQGHAGDDVLDVQLVNNRPYGLMLHYNGAAVKWGWHEDAQSLPDAFRNIIGDLAAGSQGLYLPPLSQASVGIFNVGNGKNHVFSITPTKATITADVFDVIAQRTFDKGIDAATQKWVRDVYGAAAAKDCSSMVLSIGGGIPDQSTLYNILTGDGPACIKGILTIAARNEIAQGAGMDLKTIGRLSTGVSKMTQLMARGWPELENKLGDALDFGADKRYAAVGDLGFGFSILAHYTYADPVQGNETGGGQTGGGQTGGGQIGGGSAAQSPRTPAPTTQSPTPPRRAVKAYDNYGPATPPGIPICAGNPSRPESIPGGTVAQTFTVPAGVAHLDSATVQIDADPSMVVHATLSVNGQARASSDQVANNDTTFAFADVAVRAGDSVTLTLSWSASKGKLDTVYVAGNPPNSHLVVRNSCSDGAPSLDRTDTGLRATVSGWSA